MDVEVASISISTCSENHVHIRQQAVEGGGPTLDTHMDPEEARRFACAVLEAANELSPVS